MATIFGPAFGTKRGEHSPSSYHWIEFTETELEKVRQLGIAPNERYYNPDGIWKAQDVIDRLNGKQPRRKERLCEPAPTNISTAEEPVPIRPDLYIDESIAGRAWA
ncbi:MAG TPA: hypothetical protein VG965_03615 [Patescibacteria group bacterium]|nr:hypothetical protein [Patescibacteria group bacterium]